MLTCPKCGTRDGHVLNGHTPGGYQRYKCTGCGDRFSETRTPEWKAGGKQAGPANSMAGGEIAALRKQVRELQQGHESLAEIKRIIHGVRQVESTPPQWTRQPRPSKFRRGVPTLFLSDLHWGERVFRNQTNGMNAYDMATARKRLERVVQTAIQLLRDEFVKPDYPGLVVLLGGDMLSGNIHEELRETNDVPVLPAMIDLYDNLQAALDLLADEFGRLCVFSVTGNHGRIDKKPRAKFGAADNYEWLLYEMLASRYADDDRMRFINAPGLDLHFQIYNHRYLLNHGDRAFRGGSGITGPYLPWMRGHQKKQQQYRPVGLDYDTLCIGHWHNLNFLAQNSIIVNGSLKGMDEWTMSMGFEYQTPEQAMWLTHPTHGITYPFSVHAEEPPASAAAEWVSWAA